MGGAVEMEVPKTPSLPGLGNWAASAARIIVFNAAPI
jgi:hypothetical protein